jgi:phosphatidylserine synthase
MNAMMGLIAVFFAYQGRFRESYLMMIGAATFDKLDGALARRLGLTEPLPDGPPPKKINMGSLMDDMADAISFCIVPAWIFYIALTDFGGGHFDTLPVGWIASAYAAMGMLRLVYFTLDKTPVPGFFKGMPTPAGAMLVLAPLVIYDYALETAAANLGFWGYFTAAAMVFTAVIMNVYPIRYIHLGRSMSRNPWFGRGILILLLLVVFTPYFGHVSLGCMILYLFSPLVTGRINPEVAARENRPDPIEEG